MNSRFTSNTGPFRIPERLTSKRFVRRSTPVFIWVAVLLVTVGLYLRRQGGVSATGFADEVRVDVASETTGRLHRLEVTLNENVTRGQIVASFEDGDLLLQLHEARTELDRLGFELDRERALYEFSSAGQQVDQQTDLRSFARDVENAHVEYLDALSILAESRIELQGLELILNRTRQLEQNGLTPAAGLDSDRTAFEALNERVAVEESRVAALLETYRETESRYSNFIKEYMAKTPEAALILKPLENAIRVQEIRIEQVNMAIAGRVLRSPVEGLVAEILRRPGEVVTIGQPVVSIVEPVSSRVVAYIPESRILDLRPGEQVKMTRVAENGRAYFSSIAFLGASVEQLPRRYTPGTTIPSWGMSVSIPLPDSLHVRPGEVFHLFF